MNNDYGLENIQKILLENLAEFDRICREKGIHYSLHGGTLLGAERNHQIIPWDDDIDVSMTREEFNRFKKATENLTGKFGLDSTTMWFPRFIMKTADGELAYIDILIWDYISENKFSQFLKLNLLRALQGMLKLHIDYKRFGVFTKFLLWFTHTIGLLFTQKRKINMYHILEEKHFLGSKKFIHRSNDAFHDISYIFDADYMKEYQDIEFEGKQFMVTKRYKEFLIRSYGKNYLIPPDVEHRVPGHSQFREDLSKNK
jgi:lipopolysaccharide cholinephosphotransferase